MAQSFNGVDLNGDGSILNFRGNQPTAIKSIPTSIINSNSRTTAIIVVDGSNSVSYEGTYTILTGGIEEYELIRNQQSNEGILINGDQTIPNVTLVSVGLAQQLGAGALRCSLLFELTS